MNKSVLVFLVLVLIVILLAVAGCSAPSLQDRAVSVSVDPLDYEAAFILDAEDLAERGIKDTYDDLKPFLHKYVTDAQEVIEHFDVSSGRYWVQADDQTFEIFESASSDIGTAWGSPTVALFSIVNNQLVNEDIRFYALYSGNDLQGMFLTEQQVEEAKRFHQERRNWPYLPENEYPWFGQLH